MASKATSGRTRKPARGGNARAGGRPRAGARDAKDEAKKAEARPADLRSARRPRRGGEEDAPARPAEPESDVALAAAPDAELPPLPLAAPEPAFAARVPLPLPERPRPTARRAIFLDVENTSRAQHLAHVIDHLALDRRDCQTDLVAVANWKVVGHDSARLLAQRGAHLVHSAPSTGVRDWSDLRIAVAAGIWLASARPGDTIEIVSDDRAFDAVGDVAASLGIGFQRPSYRRLTKDEAPEVAAPVARHEVEGAPRRRHRRGGRGRAGGSGPSRGEARAAGPSGAAARQPRPAAVEPGGGRHRPPAPTHAPPPRAEGHAAQAPSPAEAHTAPHDEIVLVVRELVDASRGRRISIDALANALKSRGFRRPPGSPRLMTRLRRIREIVISPSGTITLAGDGAAPPLLAPAPEGVVDRVPHDGWPPAGEAEEPEPADSIGTPEETAPEDEAPPPGGAASPGAPRGRRRRRRRWRRPRSQSQGQGTPVA